MGMFIFVHLTPASCNWLCYGCHSNALSVALAAVILHSSAWLSSKTNKREKESVCCLHLLVLRDNWPCHRGQAASVPLPHPPPFYSECIAKAASQSTLTVWKCTRGVSIHHIHCLNCCIGVACVTHECLTIWAQTLSLCLFVRASVLQSTECWTLTCPIPASLSFTFLYSAQRMKPATENHFVFMV